MSASDRRGGRRVSALLNTFYRIEGSAQEEAQAETDTDLNRQGFDAKKFFETTVASEPLPELVKRSNDLDAEIKDLDGDMQMLVYENYSKFIRATDVIKQMKYTIEGLETDLSSLEGNLGRITQHQKAVDDQISGRSEQIESLLKEQQVMKKVRILFDLPKSLRRYLDRGAYGKAAQAYCACAPILRQYKHLATFQRVLEEVELLMGQIRTALQSRLRSHELSVEEAVNSSVTLLGLGEDRDSVAREYLHGRVAALQACLKGCFDVSDVRGVEPQPVEAVEEGEKQEGEDGPKELSQDQKDLQRPESVALHTSCQRAADRYIPHLCDAVEGMQKLQETKDAKGGAAEEEALGSFVRARVEELCDDISELLQKKCPPTLVLVSCIHSVRDGLRRLHSLLPKLLTSIFMAFLNRTATSAMRALFRKAELELVADLVQLHKQCHNCGLDEVLEKIAKSEQSLIMHGCVAITDCQPLLNLLGTDQQACGQLVKGVHGQLVCFFMAFVDACHAYIGHKMLGPQAIDPQLTEAVSDSEQMASLDWCGLFALALVRIGRHMEVKAIAKLWSVAKDLFTGNDAGADTTPNQELIKTTRNSAQVVLTHYVLVSGQRLAHFFRNSVQSRNWMTVREPREARLVVEMVLKELHAFDAQLARVLGDPRKPRGADHQRRMWRGTKDSMELEMERLWAKKLQVFATIPFNRNGAIVGILRIAIKALYEYVREETFAKFGLQQIQVDTAFLGEMIRDFVQAEDAGVLDGLLDEVVMSASHRCVEPVLMDSAVVETLCDQKKARFKFE